MTVSRPKGMYELSSLLVCIAARSFQLAPCASALRLGSRSAAFLSAVDLGAVDLSAVDLDIGAPAADFFREAPVAGEQNDAARIARKAAPFPGRSAKYEQSGQGQTVAPEPAPGKNAEGEQNVPRPTLTVHEAAAQVSATPASRAPQKKRGRVATQIHGAAPKGVEWYVKYCGGCPFCR